MVEAEEMGVGIRVGHRAAGSVCGWPGLGCGVGLVCAVLEVNPMCPAWFWVPIRGRVWRPVLGSPVWGCGECVASLAGSGWLGGRGDWDFRLLGFGHPWRVNPWRPCVGCGAVLDGG